jgi:predicted nucleic acid-binding protein
VTPTLVDASFFVALLNKREAAHRRCIERYQALESQLVTCEACIAEALHILGHARAAQEAIFTSIEQGALDVPFHLGSEVREVAELTRKYADTPIDFADACLIAMADRLNTGDILTLDSDFAHYRWRKTRPFRMLIPLE